MSIMSELYMAQEELVQDLMDTWGDFKEKNDKTEALLEGMEGQVNSKEWRNLKDGLN